MRDRRSKESTINEIAVSRELMDSKRKRYNGFNNLVKVYDSYFLEGKQLRNVCHHTAYLTESSIHLIFKYSNAGQG